MSPFRVWVRFLRLHYPSPLWAFLPLHFLFTHDPQAFLPCLSPLYTRIGFPTTQFLPPFFISFPLIGQVPLDPISGPLSVSSPCIGQIPLNLILVHLSMLQVHGSQREALTRAWMSSKCGKASFQKWKGVWTSLVQTSCLSFFCKKHEIVFEFWWCAFS
jgi:hypothetical protein